MKFEQRFLLPRVVPRGLRNSCLVLAVFFYSSSRQNTSFAQAAETTLASASKELESLSNDIALLKKQDCLPDSARDHLDALQAVSLTIQRERAESSGRALQEQRQSSEIKPARICDTRFQDVARDLNFKILKAQQHTAEILAEQEFVENSVKEHFSSLTADGGEGLLANCVAPVLEIRTKMRDRLTSVDAALSGEAIRVSEEQDRFREKAEENLAAAESCGISSPLELRTLRRLTKVSSSISKRSKVTTVLAQKDRTRIPKAAEAKEKTPAPGSPSKDDSTGTVNLAAGRKTASSGPVGNTSGPDSEGSSKNKKISGRIARTSGEVGEPAPADPEAGALVSALADVEVRSPSGESGARYKVEYGLKPGAGTTEFFGDEEEDRRENPSSATVIYQSGGISPQAYNLFSVVHLRYEKLETKLQRRR